MSRSAVDATRFTATSPHAYARPTPITRASPSASTTSTTPRSNPNTRYNPNARTPPPPINSRKAATGNAPPAETPAEKVARLRQARIREREAQITTWDRIVIRGRGWADRAHKFTVYSIIAFSVVTAVIGGISVTDMILHNRRKRAAFYDEQHRLYYQRVLEAIEAEKSGIPLDEDQRTVLNRERAKVQAEERARETTWGKRIKGVFMGGLKRDEESGGEQQVVVAVPTEGEILQKIGVDQMAILERTGQAGRDSRPKDADSANNAEEGTRDGTGILQAVAEKRRHGETAMEAAGAKGGPLDRMAEGAVQAVGGKIHAAEETVRSRGGWSSWWGGK